jgi:DNA-binding NarL/FixJ family response regulator
MTNAATAPPRILLVEDEPAVRAVLQRRLGAEGFAVRAAGGVREALDLLAEEPVELVITDLELGHGSGLDILRRLPEVQPLAPAMVLTGRPSLDRAVAAMRLDAIDFVTKPASDLIERVHSALERGQRRADALRSREALDRWAEFIDHASRELDRLRSPGDASAGPGPSPLDDLSKREREVFELLVRGQGAQQVAEALDISAYTVRNHMKSIFKKLDVNSQLELIARFQG